MKQQHTFQLKTILMDNAIHFSCKRDKGVPMRTTFKLKQQRCQKQNQSSEYNQIICLIERIFGNSIPLMEVNVCLEMEYQKFPLSKLISNTSAIQNVFKCFNTIISIRIGRRYHIMILWKSTKN